MEKILDNYYQGLISKNKFLNKFIKAFILSKYSILQKQNLISSLNYYSKCNLLLKNYLQNQIHNEVLLSSIIPMKNLITFL